MVIIIMVGCGELKESNDCDGDGDYYHRGGSAPRRCEELEVSEAELVLFQEKTVFLTFVPKSVIFFIRCDKKTKTQKDKRVFNIVKSGQFRTLAMLRFIAWQFQAPPFSLFCFIFLPKVQVNATFKVQVTGTTQVQVTGTSKVQGREGSFHMQPVNPSLSNW